MEAFKRVETHATNYKMENENKMQLMKYQMNQSVTLPSMYTNTKTINSNSIYRKMDDVIDTSSPTLGGLTSGPLANATVILNPTVFLPEVHNSFIPQAVVIRQQQVPTLQISEISQEPKKLNELGNRQVRSNSTGSDGNTGGKVSLVDFGKLFSWLRKDEKPSSTTNSDAPQLNETKILMVPVDNNNKDTVDPGFFSNITGWFRQINKNPLHTSNSNEANRETLLINRQIAASPESNGSKNAFDFVKFYSLFPYLLSMTSEIFFGSFRRFARRIFHYGEGPTTQSGLCA